MSLVYLMSRRKDVTFSHVVTQVIFTFPSFFGNVRGVKFNPKVSQRLRFPSFSTWKPSSNIVY